MKPNRKIIYLLGFLFSIPIALTSYINSSLLETFTNSFQVSATYITASVITIIGLFSMQKILTRFGNFQVSYTLSVLILVSLLFLAFGNNVGLILISFIIYFVTTNLFITSLDIFVEDCTKNSNIGKARGLYLTIINFSWILAQLISGSIIARSSFKGIYLLSALFMIIVGIMLFLFLQKFKDPEYKQVAFSKTIIFFIKNKNISKIYLINLILKFFYAWMIIYTPIYLSQYLNFNWNQIGVIFTIMLLPFVILTYPLGRLSDKIGEKKMLFFGFCFSAIFTFVIPFITLPKVLLWAIILFLTRVGAATIEIMSESYFFKKVGEEHEDELSFFRNTSAISFIIAPILAILVLALTPSFKYIFFVLSVILLLGAITSLRLRDIK